MCAWLCPSLSVDLRVRAQDGAYRNAVRANDWLTIGNEELLHRVLRPIPDKEANRLNLVIARNRNSVRNIVGSDGKVWGRGCILLQNRGELDNKSDRGPITVGGCRALGMHNFGGIVIGSPLRAARDRAWPMVDANAVAQWATGQGRLMAGTSSNHELLESGAAYVRSMGGGVSNLPIACSKRGWVTQEQIEKYATEFDEIIILPDVFFWSASENRRISLLDGVLVCNGAHWGLEWPTGEPWTWDGSPFHFWTLQGAAMEAIARGWSLPPGSNSRMFRPDDRRPSIQAAGCCFFDRGDGFGERGYHQKSTQVAGSECSLPICPDIGTSKRAAADMRLGIKRLPLLPFAGSPTHSLRPNESRNVGLW
jgi:hypothetical protein